MTNKTSKQHNPLSKNGILANLDAQAKHFINDIFIYPEIGSTNDFLMSIPKQQSICGLVCLAETQSQGRGRNNKTWSSPEGNIYLSIGWEIHNRTQNLSALSLAVSVIILRALKKYPLTETVGIKWPNDLWIQNKKFAGILIENQVIPNKQMRIIIGIGLNLNLPGNLSQFIALNNFSAHPIQRDQLIADILNVLTAGLNDFLNSGFTNFINEWRAADVLYGRSIEIHGSVIQRGVAQGIDENGRLIILNAKEQIAISSGEASILVI